MRYPRQGPQWWRAWVPLLGLGGAAGTGTPGPSLPSGPPGRAADHDAAHVWLVMGWLRHNRGCSSTRHNERKQTRSPRAGQATEGASGMMSDHEP